MARSHSALPSRCCLRGWPVRLTAAGLRPQDVDRCRGRSRRRGACDLPGRDRVHRCRLHSRHGDGGIRRSGPVLVASDRRAYGVHRLGHRRLRSMPSRVAFDAAGGSGRSGIQPWRRGTEGAPRRTVVGHSRGPRAPGWHRRRAGGRDLRNSCGLRRRRDRRRHRATIRAPRGHRGLGACGMRARRCLRSRRSRKNALAGPQIVVRIEPCLCDFGGRMPSRAPVLAATGLDGLRRNPGPRLCRIRRLDSVRPAAGESLGSPARQSHRIARLEEKEAGTTRRSSVSPSSGGYRPIRSPLQTTDHDMNSSAFGAPWSKVGVIEQATGLIFDSSLGRRHATRPDLLCRARPHGPVRVR